MKNIPVLIRVFFWFDIGLCLVYLANFLVGEPFLIINRSLDLDGESSVSAWYSSIQFFCIFAFSAVCAYEKINETKLSLLIVGLPLFFLLMSIDESIQLHEWLGKKSDFLLQGGTRAGTVFEYTGIWMFVIGLPFLVVFFAWVYSVREFFLEDLPDFVKLNVGMIILVIGALGVETVANVTYQNRSIYVFQVLLEEGLEMIGATVILWAVYNIAISCFPRLYEERSRPVAGRKRGYDVLA